MTRRAPIGNICPTPKRYDINDPLDVQRLLRECRGYLHTCRAEHHGTDLSGRQFAIDGLDALMARMQLVRRLAGVAQRKDRTAQQPKPTGAP